ncbi:MAG: hypothetical protein HYU63_09140, partial [Armatimonadetes bacterium]|nr:hypothetical protein [Armatimonadota bacterium]
MFNSYYKQLLKYLPKHERKAENSVYFRLVVLIAVIFGMLATLSQEEWPDFSLLVILGTILGFIISYFRRDKNNLFLKFFLAIFTFSIFGNFLKELALNPYDTRIPLANFLLWLQTLHSYDIPERRDLNYSMLASLILVSVGAVLSYNLIFGFYFIGFVVFIVLSLFYNYLSMLQEKIQKEIDFSFGK